VAVTGVGLITPIGTGLDAVWSACCDGVSGVAEVSSYDASTFPVRIGGEVKDFSPRQHIDRKALKLMRRSVQFGVASTSMAWADSGLDVGEVDPVQTGVSPCPIPWGPKERWTSRPSEIRCWRK
jgi:3-oxoacyl-[acyl-carrier-protein] synthase II